MNIVNSGTSFKVFDESVQTYKALPAGCYQIDFHPMSGFSLISKHTLSVVEDKIYGNTEYNVEKILKSYKLSNRNFGVILSGEKGVGKSLFARVLANKANELGLPLILATANYPGLPDFISSIEQECVVLFDEFEKNFPCNYDDDYEDSSVGADGGVQNNLLSLFDGLDGGKKLFIITCNDTYKLSEFFLNRPGRFHYHFEIAPPTPEEIREYLNDKLNNPTNDLLNKVVQLSMCGIITYDCLRAIAFELNQGYPFDEVINTLNLARSRNIDLDFEVTLDNDETFTTNDSVDLFRDRGYNLWMTDPKNVRNEININFIPSQITFDENGFYLDTQYVTIIGGSDRIVTPDDYKIKGVDPKEDYLSVEKVRTIKSIKITKSTYSSFIYKYMV